MSVTSPVTGRVTGIVASGVTRSIGHRTRGGIRAKVQAVLVSGIVGDGDYTLDLTTAFQDATSYSILAGPLQATIDGSTLTVTRDAQLRDSFEVVATDGENIAIVRIECVVNSVAASVPMPYLDDLFYGEKGNPIDGDTWTTVFGNFQINGNQVQPTGTAGDFPSFLAVANGSADGRIGAVVFPAILTPLVSLVFRSNGSGDALHLTARRDATNTLRLFTVSNNVSTQFGSAYNRGTQLSSAFVLEVIFDGTTVTAFIDGEQVVQWTSVTSFQLNELVGFRFSNSSQFVYIDRFSAWANTDLVSYEDWILDQQLQVGVLTNATRSGFVAPIVPALGRLTSGVRTLAGVGFAGTKQTMRVQREDHYFSPPSLQLFSFVDTSGIKPDDHNAPAILWGRSGTADKSLLMYAGHNDDEFSRWRQGTSPISIAFGSESTLDVGGISQNNYAQVVRVLNETGSGQANASIVSLIRNRPDWSLLVSTDGGETFGGNYQIFAATTRQTYHLFTPRGNPHEGVRYVDIVSYEHPSTGTNRGGIWWMVADLVTGSITHPVTNAVLGNLYVDNDPRVAYASSLQIYDSTAVSGQSGWVSRVLSAKYRDDLAGVEVLVGEWLPEYIPGTSQYVRITGSSSGATTRRFIVSAGDSFEAVGASGRERGYLGDGSLSAHETDRFVLAKENLGEWSVDVYRWNGTSYDTWNVDASTSPVKMWRPECLGGTAEKELVGYHKGTYTTFTAYNASQFIAEVGLD